MYTVTRNLKLKLQTLTKLGEHFQLVEVRRSATRLSLFRGHRPTSPYIHMETVSKSPRVISC